ncbi:uncharacterized protein MELLADRAFT_108535 [Melampsora larici-populina 98AG31]|uniref:Uncharacterized protein n=1 Tax=Melampsora larici-populina (strain 98AG31 / pathotype 3-4-7) TaxID=747676 RepID=F4RTE4_MELLP|nr:uncharacterized protein MELLADRAFT_108535 [Melampsora larici-populina 98AG31]EGG04242.1 hypothetical protein MELLADRAFT_108535 [Melampsora larici-populina 98AG31]
MTEETQEVPAIPLKSRKINSTGKRKTSEGSHPSTTSSHSSNNKTRKTQSMIPSSSKPIHKKHKSNQTTGTSAGTSTGVSKIFEESESESEDNIPLAKSLFQI